MNSQAYNMEAESSLPLLPLKDQDHHDHDPNMSVPKSPDQTAADDLGSPVTSPDARYRAKAEVLNCAIQEIGMGRYQWQLFIVIGFGWASDNLWPIITSLILPPISYEFSVSRPALLTLAQNIGLLIGAIFWGFGCDVFGRRWAFNLTIGITAVFGLAAAASPGFGAICALAALWSIGVGGNLPVDSAIFLEFLPGSHQYLLTVLSVDWAFAQLLANLVAWPLLGNLSCAGRRDVPRRGIWGGGRFMFFTIYESPKYLMGKGRNVEAVKVVHEVARRNGRASSLTLDDLNDIDQGSRGLTAADIVRQRLEKLSLDHVRALFDTPQRAYSTTLIILVWAFVGLGFPLYNAFLPYIQQSRGAEFGDGSTYITYRNSLIIAVMGIPGCLLGAFLVELPRFGRKGALSSSTALTGVFLLLSTRATTSNALLGWNCAYNFMSTLMYSVLYAYTPEIFLTKDRGTGNALTASANRIFGIMAPVIAMFANLETAVPVYVSGVLFLGAAILVLLMPYESRGQASL
ncbi:MFS siderochrome iron transporter 1 [Penicillium maclennaniae]|uniref:MFS siderochrome iron transporter 1 n=1 Tax=Penicillium maclennaniae TaxID=1343394 RepID=UPI0025423443|nr:MFS siderochrome iron transporter 1 [Penicillium maclennaniae]KAJ5681439.1 MFS siderochrome iron transporter 1 [Penicillium maclennaniae]